MALVYLSRPDGTQKSYPNRPASKMQALTPTQQQQQHESSWCSGRTVHIEMNRIPASSWHHPSQWHQPQLDQTYSPATIIL